MKGAAVKEKFSTLLKAVQTGNMPQAQSLLGKNPYLIKYKDHNGDTLLHWAAYKGHKGIASMLITKAPKLLNVVNNNGQTPLHKAAKQGQEQVASMLIDKKPELLDAVNNYGQTALNVANSRGHTEVANILSAAEVVYHAAQSCEVEENKVANKSNPENKKFSDSRDKIQKLVSAQLQNEKNIEINLLDLTEPSTPLQKLQDFVRLAIEENKVFAIALYLHGKAWASLVIKHTGDSNLQLIYNDPTGSAFNKEIEVQKLINAIIEQNQKGDTLVTDLRKVQQNIESDSEVMIIDNLVKIVRAPSLTKADLQKLLLGSDQVRELKVKHSLVDDTDPNYSVCKLEKLLELSLKHKLVTINETLKSEDIESISSDFEFTDQITLPVIIPFLTEDKSWSGLVIKSCENGSLQIIYSNPTGVLLKEEKCAVKLVKAFVTSNPEVHIIDIKYMQDEDQHASGAFVVNNLIKLTLSNTDNFDMKAFQRILSASETIDQLRMAHDRLIHDYIAPASIIDSDRSAFELKRYEPFEHKGEYSQEKEEKVKYQEVSMPPPAYEEELSVGMHILGGEGMAQLDIDAL